MFCDYGCGQEAKHQFKNGKWCCRKKFQYCIGIRKKLSELNIGKTISKIQKIKISETLKGKFLRESHPMFGKTHSEESKKKISNSMKGKFLGKNNPMFGKSHSEETIKKMRELKKGKYLEKNNPMFGKSHSEKSRKKISKSISLTIKQIREKYPFFSQIEDMRYNPEKYREKEIQVHCKYNECPNSKENGGWFTPSRTQLYERIRNLEQFDLDHSYFYCSDNCKSNCPLYYSRGNNQLKETKKYYIPGYEIFKQEVLKRQKETEGYNFCEYCDSRETLHVHHEKPQKTNPLFILDPDNGIVLCESCHYIIGHQDKCSTGNLASKIC